MFYFLPKVGEIIPTSFASLAAMWSGKVPYAQCSETAADGKLRALFIICLINLNTIFLSESTFLVFIKRYVQESSNTLL